MVHNFIRTQRKYIQVYQMDSSFILWLACWKNNPVELGDFRTALSLFTSLQYNTKAKDVDIINHLWQRSSESPSNQNQLKQVKHHQTEIVLSHNLVLCSYKWQCQKSIPEKSPSMVFMEELMYEDKALLFKTQKGIYLCRRTSSKIQYRKPNTQTLTLAKEKFDWNLCTESLVRQK